VLVNGQILVRGKKTYGRHGHKSSGVTVMLFILLALRSIVPDTARKCAVAVPVAPLRYWATLLLAGCLYCSSAGAADYASGKGSALQPAPGTPLPGSTGAAPPAALAPPPAEPAVPAATGPLPEPALPALPAMIAPEPALPARVPSAPAGSAAPVNTFQHKVLAMFGRTADQTHDLLERGILQQVVRFDDFFGKANNQQELHTSYLLRWRNSLRLEPGGGFTFGTTLRANVELSRISERLLLTVSGDDKSDSFAPSLPEDPGNPGFDRTSRPARIVNTELRYQLIRSPDTDLFLGSGVELILPPQVFARARFQRYQRISELSLIRFAETLFAKTPYGVGETTELSLERSLNPKTLLRLSNSGTVSEEIKALEWGSELSLLHELSTRSAVTLTGGIYGNTGFDDWVNNYRVLLRYRRNFLRPWLFYELEPQVAWPRNSDGSYSRTYAVTLRLEVGFQGAENKAGGAAATR